MDPAVTWHTEPIKSIIYYEILMFLMKCMLIYIDSHN
jgi:hypothetical protein